MITRYFGLLTVILALVACMPVPEATISADNAKTILKASSITSQINDTVKTGIKSRSLLSDGLIRLSARTTTDINVQDSCLKGGDYHFSGNYDDSSDNVTGTFNIAFSDCESADGTLDGVIGGDYSGAFSTAQMNVDYNLSGDVDYSFDDQSIKVSDFLANVELDVSYQGQTETDYAIRYSHSGVYKYNTDSYKGTLTVETITAVEWSLVGLQLVASQGEVTYTDEQGNVLTVVHSVNGVSVFYNTALLDNYSHIEWLENF